MHTYTHTHTHSRNTDLIKPFRHYYSPPSLCVHNSSLHHAFNLHHVMPSNLSILFYQPFMLALLSHMQTHTRTHHVYIAYYLSWQFDNLISCIPPCAHKSLPSHKYTLTNTHKHTYTNSSLPCRLRWFWSSSKIQSDNRSELFRATQGLREVEIYPHAGIFIWGRIIKPLISELITSPRHRLCD